MKKGDRSKPYPYRAPYKDVNNDDGKLQSGGATTLGQYINLDTGLPKFDNVYVATKVDLDLNKTASAANQDKTLTDDQ